MSAETTNINRRLLIKNLALFSGGVLLLPSCLKKEEKKDISKEFNTLGVSKDQEALLAEVVETIIPATDTAGAKDLNLQLFVLTMVADCYEKEEQERFLAGLDRFNQMAENNFDKSFVKCNPDQQQQLLKKLEANEAPQEVLGFYAVTKNEVIKGFLNSKLVMTELRRYELVPARYNGYFPVKSV